MLSAQGPVLSKLIMGFWRLSDSPNLAKTSDLLAFVEANLAEGITTFDHADIYGQYTCEAIFGKALAQKPHLRDQMQLVSKCGIKLVCENRPGHKIKCYDAGKPHIVYSAENSLKNLHTDRLDLLLFHRPSPLMDPDEMAEAFTQLKESGKVLHFGVSNFSVTQYAMLQSRLPFPLVTNQLELSVMEMKALTDGTLDQAIELGVKPMAWSPLGGGRLFHEASDKAARVRKSLHELCEETGAESIDQAALAWLMHHPAKPLPVLGTSRIKRMQDAVASLNIRLSTEQWFKIWIAYHGHDVP